MRLNKLLTKWALTGMLQSNEILCSSMNDDDFSTIEHIRLVKLYNTSQLGYVFFKETIDSASQKHRYRFMAGDIKSDLFDTGFIGNKVNLTELDKHF